MEEEKGGEPLGPHLCGRLNKRKKGGGVLGVGEEKTRQGMGLGGKRMCLL